MHLLGIHASPQFLPPRVVLSRKGYFVFRNGLVPAIRTWVTLGDYVWQRWVRGWNFNIGP